MVKKEVNTNNDPRRIKRADLARILGVTPPAVTKAIASGRIPTPDTDGLLDQDEAIAAWKANTRAAANQTNKAPREKRKTGGQPKYASARARKEFALAQMAEIALRRQLGELVEIADVESFIEDIASRTRQKLEGLPARLAGDLAHQSIEFIDSRLASELHDLLLAFSKELRAAAEGSTQKAQ